MFEGRCPPQGDPPLAQLQAVPHQEDRTPSSDPADLLLALSSIIIIRVLLLNRNPPPNTSLHRTLALPSARSMVLGTINMTTLCEHGGYGSIPGQSVPTRSMRRPGTSNMSLVRLTKFNRSESQKTTGGLPNTPRRPTSPTLDCCGLCPISPSNKCHRTLSLLCACTSCSCRYQYLVTWQLLDAMASNVEFSFDHAENRLLVSTLRMVLYPHEHKADPRAKPKMMTNRGFEAIRVLYTYGSPKVS